MQSSYRKFEIILSENCVFVCLAPLQHMAVLESSVMNKMRQILLVVSLLMKAVENQC